jgi:hypothetical protein
MVKLVRDEVGHTDRLVEASLLDYWSCMELNLVQGEARKYTKCRDMSNFLQRNEKSIVSPAI